MSDVVDRVVAALNERDPVRYPDNRVEPGWRTTVGESVVQEEAVTRRGGHERHVAIYLLADGVVARERIVA